MTAALRAREATGSIRPKRKYGLLKCVPERGHSWHAASANKWCRVAKYAGARP